MMDLGREPREDIFLSLGLIVHWLLACGCNQLVSWLLACGSIATYMCVIVMKQLGKKFL